MFESFNLIPVDLRWGKKRRVMVRVALIFFAIFAISFLILNILLTISKSNIFILKKEIGQLQTSIKNYYRLKEETSGAEVLLQGYEDILTKNAHVGDVLEDLHTALPVDAWLTGIEIVAGENIVLTGYTNSLEDLETFTKLLSERKYFELCQLINVQEEEYKGQSFLMFTITCKFL
ncbi:MAG: PilN domain-containing protein [Dethiobacteria bacterium]